MQGKGRNSGIRIRIRPGVSGAGVVDGQDLNQLELGATSPVRQQGQIQKLTRAEALRAAQAEDRHGDTRAPPGLAWHARESVVHDHMPIGWGRLREQPVRAVLVADKCLCRKIIDAVFISDWKSFLREIKLHRETSLLRATPQQYQRGLVPVAHGAGATQETDRLPHGQQRGLDRE